MVLLDISMPKVDGYEVCKFIKEKYSIGENCLFDGKKQTT
jgi:CheY-like chemotaxis protein